jgi:mannose-6-phosphate isomerase-like protein (cupin superfamily)
VSISTTKALGDHHDDMALDGSEVRLLATGTRGGMAHFLLPPEQVSRAVRHRTVEELWFVIGGSGEMWLQSNDGAGRRVELRGGVSLYIPVGTTFQFRADSGPPLTIIGVTMPPWPGVEEVGTRSGPWHSTT